MLALEYIDFSDLPQVPELAFIEFEKRLRQSLGRPSEPIRAQSADNTPHQRLYVSAIIEFLRVYEIRDLDVIDISEADHSVFKAKIGQFVTRVNTYKIRCSLKFQQGQSRSSGTPVGFSADFRDTIGQHLETIRKIVRKEIRDVNKCDAILSKIASLQSEIDRERTTIDQFFCRLIDLSLVVRECGENIEPLLNKVENILLLTSRRPYDLIRTTIQSSQDLLTDKQKAQEEKVSPQRKRLLRRA